MACIEACRLLGYPIDRIITADVWATDTIDADLPPMVEFKAYADQEILRRYGIEVEHTCAMKDGEKLTYEKMFYHIPKRKSKKFENLPKGFPHTINGKTWCKKLKAHESDSGYVPDILGFPMRGGIGVLHSRHEEYQRLPDQHWTGNLVSETQTTVFSDTALHSGGITNTVQYLGIALDEPERIERHDHEGIMLPLRDIGWTEADCRKWCEENGLLSPIYTTASRGGCWFCHNQGINQLRLLRKTYPDLWHILMGWDNDSPVTFHADGRTVHDFEKRFQMEDLGIIPSDRKFKWKMLEDCESEWLDKILQ